MEEIDTEHDNFLRKMEEIGTEHDNFLRKMEETGTKHDKNVRNKFFLLLKTNRIYKFLSRTQVVISAKCCINEKKENRNPKSILRTFNV